MPHTLERADVELERSVRRRWFVCSQDVGVEKPGAGIFQKAFEQAQFWVPGIKKEEILHIGDSLEADFCGARAFGFQALLLDRSDNPRVTVYQVRICATCADVLLSWRVHCTVCECPAEIEQGTESASAARTVAVSVPRSPCVCLDLFIAFLY